MLGKLIKHEFKASFRIFLTAYVGTLLFALLTSIFDSVGSLSNILGGWVNVIIAFLYVLLIAATIILTFVLIIQRFYKNLLKDEGYLSNTLPVTADQHIWAKALPALVWTMLSVLIVFLSFFLIAGIDGGLSNISSAFGMLVKEYNKSSDMPLGLLITEFAILAIVEGLCAIMALYAAMTIGQLFSNHRGLIAVVALFVLNFIMARLSDLFYNSPLYTSAFTGDTITTAAITANVVMIGVIALIEGAVYYFICRYILTKKLNLE